MATTTDRAYSDKQAAFITKLTSERNIEDLCVTPEGAVHYERVMDIMGGGKFVSVKEASEAIGALLDLKVKEDPNALVLATEPGMYKVGDAIYRVQWNQYETSLYAKQIVIVPKQTWDEESGEYIDVEGKWKASLVYAGGTKKLGIGVEHRLSLEEAVKLSKQYALCVRCGAELENPTSVAKGMGSYCAKRI